MVFVPHPTPFSYEGAANFQANHHGEERESALQEACECTVDWTEKYTANKVSATFEETETTQKETAKPSGDKKNNWIAAQRLQRNKFKVGKGGGPSKKYWNSKSRRGK